MKPAALAYNGRWLEGTKLLHHTKHLSELTPEEHWDIISYLARNKTEKELRHYQDIIQAQHNKCREMMEIYPTPDPSGNLLRYMDAEDNLRVMADHVIQALVVQLEMEDAK